MVDWVAVAMIWMQVGGPALKTQCLESSSLSGRWPKLGHGAGFPGVVKGISWIEMDKVRTCGAKDTVLVLAMEKTPECTK